MPDGIQNLESNSLNTATWQVANKAAYTITENKAINGGHETIYLLASGDERYPISVRIGHYPNPKGLEGAGQTNVSIKMSAYVTETGGDGVVVAKPCSATLAWSMPGMTGAPDEAGLLKMIQQLVSWVTPFTLGVPGTGAIDQLKYGLTSGMASLNHTAQA